MDIECDSWIARCDGGARLDIWRIYANDIRGLSGRLGFERNLRFLGYSVELDSGNVFDEILGSYVRDVETLHTLLVHYSKAEPVERAGELLKFKDLPGGYAYDEAFVQRAVSPVAQMFGRNPETLMKAAEVLGGVRLHFDDISVEISALPKIPITYVLWKGDDEFEPSVSVFFDASASHYLPTEDLAVLGELTTQRLAHVLDYKKKEFGY